MQNDTFPPNKTLGKIWVGDLPQGALARYERDVSVNSYVIGRGIPGKLVPNSIGVEYKIKEYIMSWMNK